MTSWLPSPSSLLKLPSLFMSRNAGDRRLPHILYHDERTQIFARRNFSQQITVKTLKNSLWVVFKTLTLCSYNFWQGARFESCSVAFLFSFCLSLFLFRFGFCFVYLFVFLLLFVKYIPSRAKIVYLWINNLNFYRYLQFYTNKTVATCSHKIYFVTFC